MFPPWHFRCRATLARACARGAKYWSTRADLARLEPHQMVSHCEPWIVDERHPISTKSPLKTCFFWMVSLEVKQHMKIEAWNVMKRHETRTSHVSIWIYDGSVCKDMVQTATCLGIGFIICRYLSGGARLVRRGLSITVVTQWSWPLKKDPILTESPLMVGYPAHQL